MMKYILLISMLFVCGLAEADTYSLDFSLEVRGIKPVQGKVFVEEGESASVSANDLLIQLVPTKQDEDVVKIVADIWQGPKGGPQKLLSSPILITKLNNSAKIMETNENSQFTLTVIPKDATLGSQSYPLQDSALPMQIFGKPGPNR